MPPRDHESRMDPADERTIERLVLEYLNAGEDRDALERLCAQHPTLASELTRRVRAWSAMLGSDDDGVPREFDDHRLLRRLGSVGMGTVYLAEQRSLARAVAIKLLHPLHAGDRRGRDRFTRECAIIARLDHPGIVPVHAIGVVGDVPYCVMDLVRGQPLSHVLQALAGKSLDALTGLDLGRAVGADDIDLEPWRQPYVPPARGSRCASPMRSSMRTGAA